MLTFYLDENLHGNTFVDVLRAAGLTLELCKDHGFNGVDDAIWIPEVAARGWIAVTGDVRTRFKPWEKATIVRARARMIHVVNGKNATHPILAKNFVNSIAKIEGFLNNHPAPCLATLTRPSNVQDYHLGRPGNLNRQDLTL